MPEPNYRGLAKLVFLGWLQAIREPSWGQMACELWDAIRNLAAGLLEVAFGFLLLLTSPISYPLLCLLHRKAVQRKRFRQLRNRAAEENG